MQIEPILSNRAVRTIFFSALTSPLFFAQPSFSPPAHLFLFSFSFSAPPLLPPPSSLASSPVSSNTKWRRRLLLLSLPNVVAMAATLSPVAHSPSWRAADGGYYSPSPAWRWRRWRLLPSLVWWQQLHPSPQLTPHLLDVELTVVLSSMAAVWFVNILRILCFGCWFSTTGIKFLGDQIHEL